MLLSRDHLRTDLKWNTSEEPNCWSDNKNAGVIWKYKSLNIGTKWRCKNELFKCVCIVRSYSSVRPFVSWTSVSFASSNFCCFHQNCSHQLSCFFLVDRPWPASSPLNWLLLLLLFSSNPRKQHSFLAVKKRLTGARWISSLPVRCSCLWSFDLVCQSTEREQPYRITRIATTIWSAQRIFSSLSEIGKLILIPCRSNSYW